MHRLGVMQDSVQFLSLHTDTYITAYRKAAMPQWFIFITWQRTMQMFPDQSCDTVGKTMEKEIRLQPKYIWENARPVRYINMYYVYTKHRYTCCEVISTRHTTTEGQTSWQGYVHLFHTYKHRWFERKISFLFYLLFCTYKIKWAVILLKHTENILNSVHFIQIKFRI